VLLLDEPFSAVDAPARQALYRELAGLRQSMSTPMVLVTHDLGEARRLADRVVILDAGCTLQSGTPAQIFASPRNARVAELVGIQNHFRGRFHKEELGWARLGWGEQEKLSLRVIDKNRIEDHAQVTWVIAGDRIELLSDGAAEGNTVRCEVIEQLALGETSLCVFRPASLPEERVTLTLSTAQLRSLHAQPGCWLRLAIAPEAIHIMPQRDPPRAAQAM
jgi:molybdate transport system ATP-binding protein